VLANRPAINIDTRIPLIIFFTFGL